MAREGGRITFFVFSRLRFLIFRTPPNEILRTNFHGQTFGTRHSSGTSSEEQKFSTRDDRGMSSEEGNTKEGEQLPEDESAQK